MVRKVTSFNALTIRVLKNQIGKQEAGMSELISLKKEIYDSLVNENESILEIKSDNNPTTYQDQLDSLMSKDLCGLIFSKCTAYISKLCQIQMMLSKAVLILLASLTLTH